MLDFIKCFLILRRQSQVEARGLQESPRQAEAGIRRSWKIRGRDERLLEAQSSPCPRRADSPTPRPQELPLGHLVLASSLRRNQAFANPPCAPGQVEGWGSTGQTGPTALGEHAHQQGGDVTYVQAWNQPPELLSDGPRPKGVSCGVIQHVMATLCQALEVMW